MTPEREDTKNTNKNNIKEKVGYHLRQHILHFLSFHVPTAAAAAATTVATSLICHHDCLFLFFI